MRELAGRAYPAGVLALAAAAGALWPWSDSWPDRFPWVRAAPALLFVLAGVLGVALRQGRVTCVALVSLTAAARGMSGGGGAVLSVSLLLLPCAAAAFFAMRERGLLSPYGLVRLAMAGAIALAIWMLPGSAAFMRLIGRWFPCSVAPWCETCPGLGLGILALAVASAVLVGFRRTENPLTGPLLLSAAVFVPAGTVLRGLSEQPPPGVSGLLSFSAAGVALCWAVLDAAWRHAHLDELTGLPGRRSLRHFVGDLIGDYTIGMVDVDFFKKVNDRHGHDVGDQVLKFIAATLRQCEGAKAFRYGGEEFALVFSRGDFDQHLRAMEDIRRAVESKSFVVRRRLRPLRKPANDAPKPARRAGAKLALTVSIGAARSGGRHADAESVFKAADDALYRAKDGGRNRVCHSR